MIELYLFLGYLCIRATLGKRAQITLNQVQSHTKSQKGQLFCDVFKTSQRYLKKDVFLVTSLRRLKNIKKDVSNISQTRCLFRDISETSQKHLLQVLVIFQKYPTKIISCDFCEITKILDKLDVGSLKTLKKWKVFWEQCININQVCRDYQWADICVRVLASQPSSKPNSSILFTTSSNFFRMIRLYINCCLCLKYRNLGELDLW